MPYVTRLTGAAATIIGPGKILPRTTAGTALAVPTVEWCLGAGNCPGRMAGPLSVKEDEMGKVTMGKWIAIAGVLLSASSAAAVDPAIRCQADKLKVAAKYTFCRLKAEAEAAKSFGEPDFAKCDAAFSAGWQQAESRALSKGTPCWTSGDQAGVQGDLAAQSGALADHLAGDK